MQTHRLCLKHRGEGQVIIRKKQFYPSLHKLFSVMLPSEAEARLELCKERALANTRAFYERPEERERLILFCKEMKKLTAALYTVWVRRVEKKQPAAWQDAPVETHGILPYPAAVVVSFFAQFSPAYARAELFDLLEASVDSRGPATESTGELVFTCRWLLELLRLAVEYFRRI